MSCYVVIHQGPLDWFLFVCLYQSLGIHLSSFVLFYLRFLREAFRKLLLFRNYVKIVIFPELRPLEQGEVTDVGLSSCPSTCSCSPNCWVLEGSRAVWWAQISSSTCLLSREDLLKIWGLLVIKPSGACCPSSNLLLHRCGFHLALRLDMVCPQPFVFSGSWAMWPSSFLFWCYPWVFYSAIQISLYCWLWTGRRARGSRG